MKKETFKHLLGLSALGVLLGGCQSDFVHSFEQSQNSVTITQDDMKISLEIMDEGIIHVKKTPLGEQSYTVPNLVEVLKPQNVDWSLKESKNKLTIKTDDLKITVNSDGTIEYKNDKGKHLVSETNERTFMDLNKKDGDVVSQSFTVGDEALYGLGQFQSGIMNWKNVPMTLMQFNQEVAIPFIVSTNNYGILWNNYSVTNFNPTEKEISFDNVKSAVKAFEQDKSNAEAENVGNSRMNLDEKSNIRETTFIPEKTGLYTFYVNCDTVHKARGKILVTFNDEPVIDYSTVWVPMNYSGKKHLEAGKEYKVVFQNSGSRIPGTLSYNEPDYNKTVFSSHAATAIDYYLMAGDNPAEVVELNNKLTGNAPMMSKKNYGFWQCRERYHDQAELLDNANQIRERGIPCDMIIQDWFYWPGGTKGPEWDRARYPSPDKMAQELEDINLDVMVSVWPMISNPPLVANYGLTDAKLDNTHYFDFWDSKIGNQYYNALSDSMFKMGINSIWLDGSEPGDVPRDNTKTAMGDFKYVKNTFSLMVTKAMYEGHRKEFPRKRTTNLTRSAFTGQQRYGAVTWSGDTQTTWNQFREQISAGLNFTMAGVPYWTHDIGGFFRDSQALNPIYDDQYTNKEAIELLARWFQFGAFSPVFRIHGYKSETEIWRYGQEFEDMARKFLDLRYQLMPYIYSEAWKVTNDGLVLMSPLAYYYPEDKNCWDIADQLFFGENLMAAFVTEYQQREKDVYLPRGDWFDFWTGEKIAGGKTITVATPFDETPLFVKAGSIVPFGPKIMYATEPTDKPTHIRIYPGKDAEYTLYFDDNESYDYEKGIFSEVEFSYDESSKELEIEKGDGDYINFGATPMNFVVELIGSGKTYDVTFAGKDVTLKLK